MKKEPKTTSSMKNKAEKKLKNTNKALIWKQEKKRLLAKMDNLSKKHLQNLQMVTQYANQTFLKDLLIPLNDFERALKMKVKQKETQNFLIGMRLTYEKLLKTLREKGLILIPCAIGETYDERLHEAIETQWDAKFKVNTILQIYQSGFQLHERVIQPVKVIVNQKIQNKKENKKKGNK